MSSETLAQVKDIVIIAFLVFATVVLVVALVLGIRLYWRVGRFMDRMERVGARFEHTFGGVAIAGRALRPVTSGLGLLGLAQGIGRIFGTGGRGPDDPTKS
ncbi:MAG: hypothetical protein QF357_03015 [Dehalococcoidia bacterium]|mgnify:CR=1 FL=1|jgi:hypothetical protein|nr:hypothetical protein [Dehalococcoidia bacterium]